ncbi:hypothetical protein ACH4VR_03555 [Streptomyces sp. NPDC020883]|uniref:hypothetical protein n=1 Tax=unclassified Streptomyces TaxID=2593676 RepID=UPI0034E22541
MRGLPADVPVTLASGGVDTWKTDRHPVFVALALPTGTRIMAFDHAGTGEISHIPTTPDGGIDIVDGLIAEARTMGNGQVAHFGLAMGGYDAAAAAGRSVVTVSGDRRTVSPGVTRPGRTTWA